MILRVHPNLAQAALREHQDRVDQVWCVLRALDGGSGHLSLKDARKAVCKALDISPKTFGRILRKGERVWWVVGQRAGILHLRSLDNVCASLGVDRPGAPVLVDVGEARTRGRWRGFCLAAQFAHPKMIDKPVALATLAGRVGRSRRTAYNYLHRAGVRVQRNRLISQDNIAVLDDDAKRQGWHHTLDGGRVVTAKHLPNSYHLDNPIGAIGRARKVRTPRGQTRDNGRGSTTARVVFVAAHRDAQRARRAISRMSDGDTAYVTEKPAGAPRGASSRAWDGYTKREGGIVRL